MADALDLGSCALGRVGSSPTFRTNAKRVLLGPVFAFGEGADMPVTRP
jgi:hypothetical protein